MKHTKYRHIIEISSRNYNGDTIKSVTDFRKNEKNLHKFIFVSDRNNYTKHFTRQIIYRLVVLIKTI